MKNNILHEPDLSTESSPITDDKWTKYMIRTGQECRDPMPPRREARIGDRVARKIGSGLTDHGGYIGTVAAVLKQQGA